MALFMAGLEDMSAHFLPQRKPWFRNGLMWSILRGDWEVCSQTNYFLGTDRHLLQNVAAQDARHNIDHCLILGFLHIPASDKHSLYLRKRKHFLLSPQKTPG